VGLGNPARELEGMIPLGPMGPFAHLPMMILVGDIRAPSIVLLSLTSNGEDLQPVLLLLAATARASRLLVSSLLLFGSLMSVRTDLVPIAVGTVGIIILFVGTDGMVMP